MTELLRATRVKKFFHRGSETVHALEDVTVTFERGEIVAVVGPSGSGKTTLLYLLAGWETPDEGDIQWVEDEVAPEDSPWARMALVPQSLGLSEELTVRENIELPSRLAGSEPTGSLDELLERLSLDELADRYPLETSLGEQQRVAVARALVASPDLLLADEPTSHQDDRRADAVFTMIGELAARGSACVVATHDPEIARYANRVIEMRDGRFEESHAGAALRGDRAVWGPPPP